MEGNMKRVKKGILYISIIMLMFSMIITEPVPVHAYINVPAVSAYTLVKNQFINFVPPILTIYYSYP
jgi:hypothetical protein